MAFLAKLIPLCLLSFLLASLATGATPGGAPAADGGAQKPAANAGSTAAGTTTAAGPDGGAPAPRPATDPWPAARGAMRALTSSVARIQRMRAKSPPDAYSLNCVTERLAEARIGVQLGDREMERLQVSTNQSDAAEQAYALRRLQLLAERAGSVLIAASTCIRDDPGGVSATKVEVEVSRGLPEGDPTAPPLPGPTDLRPANDR